jgi:hypothetical protein
MKAYEEVKLQFHYSWPRQWIEVSGQLHVPAALTPREIVPNTRLDRRLGGPQSRFGRRGENCLPYRDSNSEPSVVQPVASRYTECATPALWTLLYTMGSQKVPGIPLQTENER